MLAARTRSLASRLLFPVLLLFFGFAAASALWAQSAGLPAASSGAQQGRGAAGGASVGDTGLVRLAGNTHPAARAEFDHGRVADEVPQEHILMLLKRTPAQQQALARLMEQQHDPRSRNFHRWLTPESFGAAFGPGMGDINKVTGWLGAQGFRVNRVAPGRTFIDFSGTVGQVNAAFHTEMHHYRVGGEEHIANASDPLIPAVLEGVVAGFRALNDFHPQPVTRHTARVAHFDRGTRRWVSGSRAAASMGGAGGVHPLLTEGSGASANYFVTPQDLAQIYGVNQVWKQTVPVAGGGTQALIGTGQTIGVIGDTDLTMADIQAFRDQFGITAVGPHGSVQVDHPPASVCSAPNPDQTNFYNNDPEGYIDAEWVGATAPDATIDFVTCANAGVTAGTDLAATYLVNDAAHVSATPVLSSSYGDCEGGSAGPGGQFYVSLWEQAAAEGITVVVATADSGGASCDPTNANPGYAAHGISVNAEAATPFNIAAGGTDFSDVFSGTTGTYWNAANGSYFESAKSYVPEMTWNDSCASPLVLQHFGQGFTSSEGPDGFCTYAAKQPIPPGQADPQYFNPLAGGGGPSAVSAKPSWQAGVIGIPKDGARDLPDIAMFAGSGFIWGHALVYCDAFYNQGAGQTCDFSNANDVYANEDGGTSFVAPAFAGIMALIDQQSGSRQGQANYVLYPLAGQQYIRSNDPAVPSLTTCAADLGTDVLSSCMFHDVNVTPNPNAAVNPKQRFVQESIAVPCTGTATAPGTYTDQSTDPASHTENCYGYEIQVTQNGGTLTTTPIYYGILSTGNGPNAPAFAATAGYDLATGLGSPNVASLVNAPQWSTGGSFATITLGPTGSPVIAPGETIVLSATVLAASGGQPIGAGKVTFYSDAQSLGTANLTCASNGVATLSVTGAQLSGDGTHSDIYAIYTGGTDRCAGTKNSYYGVASTPITIVVAQLNSAITGAPLYAADACCFFSQPTPLTLTVTGSSGSGVAPSGTVQVLFQGQTLGTGTLTQSGASTAALTLLVPSTQFIVGNNTVVVTYGGDVNYLPAQGGAGVTLRSPAVSAGDAAVGQSRTTLVNYTYTTAGAIQLNYDPHAANSGGAQSDFSDGGTGTCQPGVPRAAGTVCAVSIAFKPTIPGVRKGSVALDFTPAQGAAEPTLDLFAAGMGDAAQISLDVATQTVLNASLNQPQSVVFNPSGSSLIVANSNQGQVGTVPAAGGALAAISTGTARLSYPSDLTYDAFGDLLIADANGAKVVQLSPAGAAQTVDTGAGFPLSLPTAIRTDFGGNLFIADGGTARVVQVPAEDGAPRQVDTGSSTLSFPQALAVDNGGSNLFVGDGDTNQIVRVGLDGSGASPVAIAPCAASVSDCTLNSPTGIAFNLRGDMYVVDAAHQRVLLVPVTHAVSGTPTVAIPFSGLLNPSGITLDGSGNLYVPDIVNGTLNKLAIGTGAVSFGSQAVGAQLPVTITNVGNSALKITGVSFASGTSAYTESDSCVNAPIAPGGSCVITLHYSNGAGTSPDTLSVQSNAYSTTPVTVRVSGGAGHAP